MISIDYQKLTEASERLKQLVQIALSLAEPLPESMGNATETEREIIGLLSDLCKKDIPEMITQTDKLLEHIKDEFQESEQTISSIIING